jgi:ABC-type dipeptide/oligopeptide/nickel transport system permease subunit
MSAPASTTRTITGVEALLGSGAAEPKGFWADAWSRVLKRRGAVLGLCWLSVVAFFAVTGPLLASGHPLLMWTLDASGNRGGMTSPLLEHLRASDWLVLLGGIAGLLFIGLPLRTPRGERLGMLISAGVQAGLSAAAALAIAGFVADRNAPGWARSWEQTAWFIPLAAGVASVTFGLIFAFIPSTRTLRGRLLLVGLTTVIAGVTIAGTWKRPPDRFEYLALEREGKAEMLFTLVPWSPNQRPDDRDAKTLPPGASSESPLERIITQGLPPTGVLATEHRDRVKERVLTLPMAPSARDTLARQLETHFTEHPQFTRSELRAMLARDLKAVGHPYRMGTDALGVDVASQMIHACRLAISIGFVSTGLAVLIGVTMGSLMGYFGGIIDLLLYRVVEVFMAVPVLFLLIVAAGVLPRNTYVMMAIIGCFTWHSAARFTRAEFMRLRSMDFVQSAKAVGLPLRSILFRHMLPNGVTPVLVDASFLIAAAILAEATLSYLGLGPPDQASWGRLLASATSEAGAPVWWLAVFPGLAIFLTVLSYNMIGEALRDAIDPKLRKARV